MVWRMLIIVGDERLGKRGDRFSKIGNAFLGGFVVKAHENVTKVSRCFGIGKFVFAVISSFHVGIRIRWYTDPCRGKVSPELPAAQVAMVVPPICSSNEAEAVNSFSLSSVENVCYLVGKSSVLPLPAGCFGYS